MATAFPIGARNREDDYELEMSRVREKIKAKFAELIDCLKVREIELLRELDNILASYLSYRSELEKVNERRIALERTKSIHLNELSNSPIKSVHEDCIARVNAELNSNKSPVKPKMVSFECDSNKVLAELIKLGNLVEKVSGIDYKRKMQPLVSVCVRGKGIEQFTRALGLTVDNNTGNIYVADQDSNCVKVFDCIGKYLFKFGDTGGLAKLKFPRGVAIYGDSIFISIGNSWYRLNHAILHYKLDGQFISRIGATGEGEKLFNYPYGLTIDQSNGDIYICDCNNNRIQILSIDYSFKSQFGKETLKSPIDVKLSKEYIFVLDVSNPCLHLFGSDYILLKSVISREKWMAHTYPNFFFIDQTGNIILSNYYSNSIHIFNNEFQLIHKIPVSHHPTGVTVDNQGRVIVVCQAREDCLQIF